MCTVGIFGFRECVLFHLLFFNENHIKRVGYWSPEYSGAAAVVCALQEGGVFFCQGGNERKQNFLFCDFRNIFECFLRFLGAKMMFWMFVLSGGGRESA